MGDGVLRITQEFVVKFKVLFFKRTYRITMDYTITRGSDITVLIRNAEGQANSGHPVSESVADTSQRTGSLDSATI